MRVRKSFILILIPILFVGALVAFAASHPIKDGNAPQDSFKISRVTNTSGIEPQEVYTFMCEMIEIKPSTMTQFCADFGEAIYAINWSRWSADGAEGTGTYSYNDCEPSCAEGTIREAKVSVQLKGLYTDGARFYLRNFSYLGKEPFLEGRPMEGGWDTAEFYINVPDMRTNP